MTSERGHGAAHVFLKTETALSHKFFGFLKSDSFQCVRLDTYRKVSYKCHCPICIHRDTTFTLK